MEGSTSESTPLSEEGCPIDESAARCPHTWIAVASPDYWHPGTEEFAGLRAASPSKVILVVVLRWRSEWERSPKRPRLGRSPF